MKNSITTTMSKTIVFFGSGPVAASSLQLLAKSFSIEAIVTKPTTEQQMSMACPGAKVFTVSNKEELDELIGGNPFKSSVGVLIDFGIIVNQKVIDYFTKGIVNSHFSLLPKLRGADPISFAILEGEEKTGVSLMLLVKAMDEGPILAFAEQSLTGTENAPQLTKNLIKLSDDLLKNTLPAYLANNDASNKLLRSQKSICESHNHPFKPTYTRKLTKQDGVIDWNKTATQLEREVRAFIEWPKSHTKLVDKDLVITKAQITHQPVLKPGKVLINGKRLIIGTSKNNLEILQLKPAGKNEMTSQAFLAGYKHLF